MATRPVLIEAYSGAGGAAMGYHRAGFEVICIDVEPQPRNPFEFIQADLRKFDLVGFARERGAVAVTGGPPCKVHTKLSAFSGTHHTDLLLWCRKVFRETGLPYVIENVPGAPMRNPVTYCGTSFPELAVRRHRLFEANFPLTPPPCDHAGQKARSPGYPVKQYKADRPAIWLSPTVGVYGRGQGLGPGEIDLWRRAMDIDWMIVSELSQAIPPAFTEHIGHQLQAHLSAAELVS